MKSTGSKCDTRLTTRRRRGRGFSGPRGEFSAGWGIMRRGLIAVMEEAGLTAGGFYAHFDSKQALLAEAIEHSARRSLSGAESSAGELTGRRVGRSVSERYFSRKHCRQIEDGCPLAALVSEVSRADEAVKANFEEMVRELVGELASHAGELGGRRPRNVRWRRWPCAWAGWGWRARCETRDLRKGSCGHAVRMAMRASLWREQSARQAEAERAERVRDA